MADEPKKRSKHRPTNTWKDAERKILRRYWGAERRGAYVRGVEGPKPDSPDDLQGWSIEIKHSKHPRWGLIVDAVNQAETNQQNPGDIPVAVIHPEGAEYKDSLVVMRLETFAEFFVNRRTDNV